MRLHLVAKGPADGDRSSKANGDISAGSASGSAVRCSGVGVRYGRRWALRDCTVDVPEGSVVAVVGSNGAGKTSLLRAVNGLQRCAEGGVELFGRPFDRDDPSQLALVGYVSQRKALYPRFRISEMLRFGAAMNQRWDDDFARSRIEHLGLDPERRIGALSGGEHTQVALTIALAKRPALLVLDEPLGDLDPLARHEVLGTLMADVTERGITVLMSSHILGELEAVCDRLLVLRDGRVVLAGDIDEIIAAHRSVTGPADGLARLACQALIVDHETRGGSASAVIASQGGLGFLDPRWQQHPPALDCVVLGYLRNRPVPAVPAGSAEQPGARR